MLDWAELSMDPSYCAVCYLSSKSLQTISETTFISVTYNYPFLLPLSLPAIIRAHFFLTCSRYVWHTHQSFLFLYVQKAILIAQNYQATHH